MSGLQLFGRQHEGIDEDAGDPDILRCQGSAFGQALDLRDDDAAVVVRGVGQIQRAQRRGLLLERQIAVVVGSGRPDDGDVGDDSVVKQPLLAVERMDSDEVLGGGLVHPPAVDTGIDEGVHADGREHAGLFGGGGAVQLIEHARGEVVGLDLVVLDHLPDQWRLRTGRARRIGTGDHPRQ